jgi:hypothetical protein
MWFIVAGQHIIFTWFYPRFFYYFFAWFNSSFPRKVLYNMIVGYDRDRGLWSWWGMDCWIWWLLKWWRGLQGIQEGVDKGRLREEKRFFICFFLFFRKGKRIICVFVLCLWHDDSAARAARAVRAVRVVTRVTQVLCATLAIGFGATRDVTLVTHLLAAVVALHIVALRTGTVAARAIMC